MNPNNELFMSGHNACAGCGASILLRHIMEIAGKNTIIVLGTGCMEVVSTLYPNSSWKVPLIHSAFANTASTASGVYNSLKAQNRDKKEKIIAIAGDGGTFDIGLQALSGAFSRNEKIIYICYDNEAYSNTGIQKSSSTPKFADTTTTETGKYSLGNNTNKKDIPFIMASHGENVYVATASIGFYKDFEEKLKKAIEHLKEGPSYIQVLTPCIPGWKISSNQTIELSKNAVYSKIYPLYEIEKGKILLNDFSYNKKVEDYLIYQGRFSHLTKKEFIEIQNNVDKNFLRLKELSDKQIKIF